jgi:cytochrome b561
MAVAGLLLAIQSGILGILIGERPEMPADFWVYKLRSVHYLISRLLWGLIALHVAGALYHTRIRRDGLLLRMRFGARIVHRNEPTTPPQGHRAS